MLTYTEKRAAMIRDGSLVESDAWICDLGHNPFTVSRANRMLATLTRSGSRWSFHHQRPMMGIERMAAMGVVIPDLVPQGMVNNPYVQMQAALCEHMAKLSDSDCVKFSGNGMHLATAGAIVLWVLSHTVPLTGGPKAFPLIAFRDDDEEH